jgi:hypothetical protein
MEEVLIGENGRRHGPSQRISRHKEELIEVQKLFHDRRYKQCVALCTHLQRTEVSPLQGRA